MIGRRGIEFLWMTGVGLGIRVIMSGGLGSEIGGLGPKGGVD